MGDIWYLVREKFQLYNHLLDMKRRYQDILNDAPSPSRNYHLSQTEYLINFTKHRWESIYIPPLADQFVHGVANTKMVEVKEQFDDLASTMLTKEVFYSTVESYFGKKNCNREDPVGASKITSTSSDEDDPTKSIGICDLISTSVAQPFDSEDFGIVISEKADSIPTSVQLDSSSQVLNRVESQKVNSNFAGAVKEKDGSFDCVNFPVIETAKIDVKEFTWINQIKIGEVNYPFLDFHFNKFEKNLEYLKELLCISYNKSNCEDCCSIHLNVTRSLFDQDFWFLHGIVHLCITDAAILDDINMFDKRSESRSLNGVEADVFWQLKMGKVFDRGKESDIIKMSSNSVENNKRSLHLLARVVRFNNVHRGYVHNSPSGCSYMIKMAMLRSMPDSDHGGVCFYLYFVIARKYPLTSQLGNGSRNSLKIYVIARKYAAGNGIMLASSREEFLVEGVKIKDLLVMVNGGVRFYGYLRWKFRLFPPGIWSLRSVAMKVKFSVFNLNANWTAHSKSFWVVYVYIEVLWSSDEDYIREHGFPNASEWLRVVQLEFLRGVRKFEANGGPNLHYVLMSIPSQVGAINESESTFHLTGVVPFITAVAVQLHETCCCNIDAISRRMCGMLSNSGVVVIAEHNGRSAHIMVFSTIAKSAYHAAIVQGYQPTTTMSCTSIGGSARLQTTILAPSALLLQLSQANTYLSKLLFTTLILEDKDAFKGSGMSCTGNDRKHSPYRSLPPIPYRSPSTRSPDISPPKGAPPRYSQSDLRPRRTFSSSDLKAASQKWRDQVRSSRYAVDRPAGRPSSQRSEPLEVQPIRSIVPPNPSSSQKSKA
ncbi:hypothetical protein C5167_032857 [Papaver somniferum]|uniref:Uncharacterized protein n=1 Tax=Papaver somniferum TaxID=3469 RepID=A0A4Y7K8S3_PAPSO|nr:hypothetical protein C5167_032857 [Papaver somniferum]